jgi:hypothetical protein
MRYLQGDKMNGKAEGKNRMKKQNLTPIIATKSKIAPPQPELEPT